MLNNTCHRLHRCAGPENQKYGTYLCLNSIKYCTGSWRQLFAPNNWLCVPGFSCAMSHRVSHTQINSDSVLRSARCTHLSSFYWRVVRRQNCYSAPSVAARSSWTFLCNNYWSRFHALNCHYSCSFDFVINNVNHNNNFMHADVSGRDTILGSRPNSPIM